VAGGACRGGRDLTAGDVSSRPQGERNEARQLLAEVYYWFTEGFDTADLREAKALLDQLARG